MLDTGVIDVELGETTIMTLKYDDTIDMRGGGVERVTATAEGTVTQLCCGDEHFAYLNSSGAVYHLGGLF
jgi:hypothetical protein